MKLLPLFVIESAAFLLILAETYFFFDFVVPLGPIGHSLTEYTGFAFLKVVLIVGLGVFWFVVMIGMTRLYVRARVESSPKPSS
jgi:hypothetical protein